MRQNRAFTLIELLVVISIIALLSSVVLGSLNAAREKARIGAARQFAAQVERVAGEQAVGIWDFDECSGSTATDRSGFGNNGALTNMTPTWASDTPTGTGCALSFDGTNDYIQAGSGSSLVSTALTWSAWVKTTDVAGCNTVVSKGSTSSGDSFDFGLGDCTSTLVGETIAVIAMNSGNRVGYMAPSSSEVFDGRWHHVVLVADGTVYKVYLDGRERPLAVGQGVNNGTSQVTNQNNTVIGAVQRTSLLNFFDGSIDSVRIFTKGLTAAEVGRLYAEGIERHEYAYE